MEILFLLLIILAIIQWYLKAKQTKELQEHYNKFLQDGNVLLERNKGIFSGAIIMFQLDEKANIKNCLLLSGATFSASWRECKELVNQNLLSLEHDSLNNYKKIEKKAINKAIKSYQKEN